MGWIHIPDIKLAVSGAEDNPCAAPKQEPVGKVSVNFPTHDWLCKNGEFEHYTWAKIPIQKLRNRESAEGPVCQTK